MAGFSAVLQIVFCSPMEYDGECINAARGPRREELFRMRKMIRRAVALLLAGILSVGMTAAAAAENPSARTDAEIQQSVVTREGEAANSIGSLLLQLVQLSLREDVRNLMRIEDFNQVMHEVVLRVLVWMFQNRDVTMKILLELGLTEEDLVGVGKIWDSGERVVDVIRNFRDSEDGQTLRESAAALDSDPEFQKDVHELMDMVNEGTVSNALKTIDSLMQEGKDILQKEADAPAGVLSREAEKRHLDRESFTGRLLSEMLRLTDLNAEVSSTLLGIMSNENVWTVLLQITNGSKELDDVLQEEYERLSNDPDVEGLLHRAMNIVDKLVEKAKDMDLTPIYDAFGQPAEEEGAE